MNELIIYARLNQNKYEQTNRVYSCEGISPTIVTVTGGGHEVKLYDGCRIRKMTPKECFRLMGFEDKDVDILVENGISKTQLYKMAGNSIVVNVLEAIFEKLYGGK